MSNMSLRCTVQFPSFIHTQKRNPQTHMKDPDMVWDFWSLRPESLHQVPAAHPERAYKPSARRRDMLILMKTIVSLCNKCQWLHMSCWHLHKCNCVPMQRHTGFFKIVVTMTAEFALRHKYHLPVCRCLSCSAIEDCLMASATWMATAPTPSNWSMPKGNASTASSTTRSVWRLAQCLFKCVDSLLKTRVCVSYRLIKESRTCPWRRQSAWPPPTRTMPLETSLMPLPMTTTHPGPSTSRSWLLNRRRNSTSTPLI